MTAYIEDGTLYIQGTGQMNNFSSVNAGGGPPWNSNLEANTTIKSLMIGNGVSEIGANAFNNCIALKTVSIASGVKNIGSQAFYGCESLVSVTLPDSVTVISSSAFRGCSSLSSITYSDSVELGTRAFQGCISLTSVIIPKNVAYGAFIGCTSLTSVTIPSRITSIGSYAFQDCTNLVAVYLENSSVTINDGAFGFSEYMQSKTRVVYTLSAITYNETNWGSRTSIAVVNAGTVNVDDVTDSSTLLSPAGSTTAFTGWYDSNDNLFSGTPQPGQIYNARYANASESVTVTLSVSGNGSVGYSKLLLIKGATYTINGDTATFVYSNSAGTKVEYVVTATPDAATVEKTYTFTKWSGTSGTVNGDVELTAYFSESATKYIVSFVSDGKTVSTKSVDYNKTVSAYNATKSGYTLVGWYYDQAGTNRVSFPMTVTENITVYAVWQVSDSSSDSDSDRRNPIISDNTTSGSGSNSDVTTIACAAGACAAALMASFLLIDTRRR
ncbi:MAG: leucine-rich repeat protein [Thermoplasmata archaeon]|nr:leucine-rich repeat protein [Thermoplasmata archaeon]